MLFTTLFALYTSVIPPYGINIIYDELRAQKLTHYQSEQMVNIAWCESRLNSNSQNKMSSAAGLFQITKGTWKDNSDYDWSQRYDWYANMHTAVKIYKKRGTQPWNASKHCWDK